MPNTQLPNYFSTRLLAFCYVLFQFFLPYFCSCLQLLLLLLLNSDNFLFVSRIFANFFSSLFVSFLFSWLLLMTLSCMFYTNNIIHIFAQNEMTFRPYTSTTLDHIVCICTKINHSFSICEFLYSLFNRFYVLMCVWNSRERERVTPPSLIWQYYFYTYQNHWYLLLFWFHSRSSSVECVWHQKWLNFFLTFKLRSFYLNDSRINQFNEIFFDFYCQTD